MRTTDLLLSFFEAENRRDWVSYRAFLAPDVVWELHTEQVKITRGREDYLRAMREAYEGADRTFVCEYMRGSRDGRRVVTILRNDLGERSCDIFEFSEEGLIVREYEYILA